MQHKYTTNIPYARIQLLDVATFMRGKGDQTLADTIENIVEHHMIRRPGARRAPVQRSKVTKRITQAVLHDLKHTDLTQEEIGRRHNIDGGRVSEIERTIRN